MLCESFWIHWKQYNATFISHMSMFANIALLGGGVRVIGFELENKENQKEIKGTTKPLMANLDITHLYNVPSTSWWKTLGLALYST